MERNEFRIGNIVADEKGNIITIFNILQSYCRGHFNNELEDQLLYYENIKPIKLTEEWLFKFGFVKIEKSFNSYIIKGKIIIDTERFIVTCKGIIISICRYVHQLQNLYYALTGKELVLKENLCSVKKDSLKASSKPKKQQ